MGDHAVFILHIPKPYLEDEVLAKLQGVRFTTRQENGLVMGMHKGYEPASCYAMLLHCLPEGCTFAVINDEGKLYTETPL